MSDLLVPFTFKVVNGGLVELDKPGELRELIKALGRMEERGPVSDALIALRLRAEAHFDEYVVEDE